MIGFPKNWKIRPANEVCKEIVDCINKTAPVVDGPTEFKMIRTTNVKAGRVNLEDTKFVDEATFRIWTRRLRPKLNDIILTREAPLGEVGLLRSEENVFLGQRTMIFRADEINLTQPFLYYSMLGATVQAQIFAQGSGSTVEHLRVPDAEKLKIPFPEIKTQRKIAAILTAYDDLIETNKRRIALLEKMAEQIYCEWFVRMRFPGHEKTKVVKGVPEGWKLLSISKISDEIRNGVKKKDLSAEEKYLGLEHIPQKSIAIVESSKTDSIDSDKLRFQYGDVLFGKIRPYLHKVALAHFSGVCSTDTIVIRPKEKIFEGFLLFTVFSETFINFATTASTGTKMPRADWDFLKKLEIKIPGQHLLEAFQNHFENFFSQITSLLKSNETLILTRDLLLPRLLSGKLSVENLDIQFPPSMREEVVPQSAAQSAQQAYG